MLSRRNIRIKVMQILYAMGRDVAFTNSDIPNRYNEIIKDSFELYLLNLYHLMKVTEYSLEDAKKRSSKHLPTDADKAFTAKLHANDLIQSIVTNRQLRTAFETASINSMVKEDDIRTLYKEFLKEDSYQSFIKNSSTKESETTVLLDLYKMMIKNEIFTDSLDDHYPNWIDDKSLIVGTMKKTIKALPMADDFIDGFRTNKETVEFGHKLLQEVCGNDEELHKTIDSTLENWDMDRVAIIDLILIKMALCEFRHFPTIPTKVTLNEFVEISKLYSTDKSREFINGVLDKLLKRLIKAGEIKKEGRGLEE